MIPAELSRILSSDPAQAHGQVCFTGTRVPLQIFVDYIGEGLGLAEFLADYPNVPRESAEAVLGFLDARNREAFDLDKSA